jgi:hypothetical protein
MACWRFATRGIAAALGLVVLAGCGRRQESGARSGELTFEQLADTVGLSSGAPILQDFDAYRMENGTLRVEGRARLPEGTRLHVAVKHEGERSSLAMVEVTVTDGAFDSPPIIGETGVLPKGRYVFEISAMFLPESQSASVLRETDNGRALRGPGITRTQIGTAMLWLRQELTR